MFVFGTKALEQFIDRLVEWPQYRNHILQISHLRATHAELVALTEGALARISEAHAEPDVVYNASSDYQHGPNQSSPANVEKALVGDDSGEEQLFSSESNVVKDGISTELDIYQQKLKDCYGVSCACPEVGASPRVHRFPAFVLLHHLHIFSLGRVLPDQPPVLSEVDIPEKSRAKNAGVNPP